MAPIIKKMEEAEKHFIAELVRAAEQVAHAHANFEGAASFTYDKRECRKLLAAKVAKLDAVLDSYYRWEKRSAAAKQQ